MRKRKKRRQQIKKAIVEIKQKYGTKNEIIIILKCK
jgi:hypothetical protein